MRIKLWFNLIFIAITFCCCTSYDNDKQTVLIQFYDTDEIIDSDTLISVKCIHDDSIYYTFTLELDTLAYSFKKSLNNDSALVFDKILCPMIESKQFVVNDSIFKIFKYFYDKTDVDDEEEYLFYNERYGLLIGYNNSLSYSISSDETSMKLITLIKEDKTGFYEYNIPPPPKMTNDK